MPKISIGDCSLHYEEHGSGEPLLLVPGLGGVGASFFKQVPELSEYFRVIVHDHRGCGQSDQPVMKYSVEQMTQELGLTSDQAKQLDAILMQWHAEAKMIHEQSDAQIEQLRQKGRNQIRVILTPEQKPKFEEFLTKLDAERKGHAPK